MVPYAGDFAPPRSTDVGSYIRPAQDRNARATALQRSRPRLRRAMKFLRQEQEMSKQGTLAVAALATAILMLDIAVVNTALGHIADDLGAGLSGIQWVVVAYTLALASVVLTAGSVADRLGRKRVFMFGT